MRTVESMKKEKNELIVKAEGILHRHGARHESYTSILKQIDDLTSDIADIEYIQRSLPAEERKPVVPATVVTNVVENVEQRRAKSNEAFRSYFMTGGEHRDLTTDPSSGGIFVEQAIHPVLFEIKKHFYPVLEQLTVVERKNSSPLQLASEDSTSLFLKAGAEAAAPAESDPTMAKTILDFDVVTATTKVSKQLISDSAFDLTQVITKSGGKQLAYTLDKAIFANTDAGGNALSHQANLLSTVSVGTTTASVAAGIGEGDLAAVVESVDNLYWPDASFVMSPSTYLTLLQQKDGSGRRFWPELGDPDQPRLWQFPVYLSSSLPNVAANAIPVMFGAFSNVVLAYQGLGLTILRERFADQNLLGYQLYSRISSTLVVPNSLRSIQIASA